MESILRQHALTWIEFGQPIVPIGRAQGGKQPLLGRDWPTKTLNAANELESFDHPECVGIGLLLTEVVDVDLDCAEAVALAPHFLPETTHRFGRGTSESEHRLYLAPAARKTTRLQNPLTGKTLVELRAGARAQTVLPPSPHLESGTTREWFGSVPDNLPPDVDAAELLDAVKRLAAAALILQHYPGEGSRHDFALALAGYLAREVGMPLDEAKTFVRTIAEAAKDDETRATEVESTYGQHEAGNPITATLPLDAKALGNIKQWLGARGRYGHGKVTQTDLAIGILRAGCELWQTPEGKAHVTVNGASFPVRSSNCRDWLADQYFKKHGKPLTRKVRDEAIDWAEGHARVNGAKHRAWLRYAEHEGAIFVDLGHDDRRVVKITPDGWEIVEGKACPARFVRSRTTGPLPLPERGGSIDLLWQHLNVSDLDSRICVDAWLLGAIRPDDHGGYAGLVFEGEAGTAKTTTSRLCAALVDPQTIEAGGPPTDERSFLVMARSMHCPRLDNLRGIDARLSDAMCRLSTGGGSFNRALYTDDELACFEVRRPWIANGIDRVVKAEDLVDRAVIVSLQPIDVSHRRTERELWEAFLLDAPKILGALYDAAALALKRSPEMKRNDLPRLADWGQWVEAGSQVFGWDDGQFSSALRRLQARASRAVLAEDPLAAGIMELVDGKDCWEGTYRELQLDLYGTAAGGARELKNSRTMSHAMRRLSKPLRDRGVYYSTSESGKSNITRVRIERKLAA